MYLVRNKTHNSQPELYPAFLIDGLFKRAKKDKNVYVKPLDKGYEIQTKKLWIEVNKVEFTNDQLQNTVRANSA